MNPEPASLSASLPSSALFFLSSRKLDPSYSRTKKERGEEKKGGERGTEKRSFYCNQAKGRREGYKRDLYLPLYFPPTFAREPTVYYRVSILLLFSPPLSPSEGSVSRKTASNDKAFLLLTENNRLSRFIISKKHT